MLLEIISALVMVFSGPVYADVYKCKSTSGVVEYRADPCPKPALSLGKVNIKQEDPQFRAQADARFSAWKAEQDRLAIIKIQEDKDRQLDYERQLAIDALRRSAFAQEAQAAKPLPAPVIISPIIYPNRPLLPSPPPGHHPEPRLKTDDDQRFAPYHDYGQRFAPYR